MTLRVIFAHSPCVVRLEHHPLRALVDRFAQEEEQPADVDVLPLGVGVAAEGARAPHQDVAVEVADAVDAAGVETVLLRFADAGI